MRTLTLVLSLLAIICLLDGTPATAKPRKWTGGDIDKLLSDMSTLIDRSKKLKGGMVQLGRFNKKFAAGRDAMGPEVLERLTGKVGSEIRKLATGELDAIHAYLKSDGDAEVRDVLLCIVNGLAGVLNAMLGVIPDLDPPCDGEDKEEPITIESGAVKTAIGNAPALALYPIYRLLDVMGNLPDTICKRLGCVAEILEFVVEILRANSELKLVDANAYDEIRATVASKPSTYRGYSRTMRVTATLCESTAKKIESSDDANNAEGQVEIWGWAGVTVSVAPQARVAALLTITGKVMRQLATFLAERVRRWLREAHEEKVLANQAMLLEAQGG
jgi:hypothetical protein